MAILRVNKLEKVGRQSFSDGTFTIGRSMKNDMCLPHASVSRHHCTLEIVESGVTRLRDLDSRHGTTLNGRPVTDATLHDGDVIGVGIFEIRYCDQAMPRDDDPDHEIDLEILPDEPFPGDHALSGSATGSIAALAPADESDARAAAHRDAALNELRERAADQTARLDEARARADRAEAAGESLRHDLEQSLRERDDAARQRDELSGALADRDAAIEQRAAELADVRADFDRASSDLARSRADAVEHRAHTADLEARLARQTAVALEQLRSHEQQRAALDERLRQHENESASLRRQAEKAALDLGARTEKLDDALRRIDMLKGDVKALRSQVGDLRAQSRNVDQFIENIRASARQVLGVLQQLATVRANVQHLESAYVQANEWADDAESFEGEKYDELIAQRDAVGEQLETAHGQLDSTITELYQVTAQLTQYIVSEPVRAALEAASAATAQAAAAGAPGAPGVRGFFSRLVRQ